MAIRVHPIPVTLELRRPENRIISVFYESLILRSAVIFLVLLIIVMALLFTNPNQPSFAIEEFSVQPLNKTAATTDQNNATLIRFGMKIRNKNHAIGLHYNSLNLSFFYLPNATTAGLFVGEYRVTGFYQGNWKTKHVRDIMKIKTGTLGDPVVLNGTMMMVFKLEALADVRYKFSAGKIHKIQVGAIVGVGGLTGEKIKSEDIILEDFK